MPTIISGQSAAFPVTLQKDGEAVAIAPGSTVQVSISSMDGRTSLLPPKAVLPDAAGADWSAGVVAVSLDAAETGLPAGEALLTVTSTRPPLAKRFRVVVEALDKPTRSALFVRDIAVDKMRADSLMMAARGAMPGVRVSDDYLWDKLLAAEASIAHELRVPLVPTTFFPATPTDEEIAALGDAPWGLDPGYDYEASAFQADKWGFLKLRNKPLIRVEKIAFAYPGGNLSTYLLPLDWLQVDRKYGQVQFVPSATAYAAPLNAFVMQAIGAGRTIPLAIRLTYVAGLEDAARTYPDLLDAIMKMATLKIVEDAFLPQSGSISADGLSQSVSNDMEKHHDTVQRILHGDKGSNGGLMTAIHGVRLGVLGA